MSASLAGKQILVTRPSGQAKGLINALQACGANVLHRPALAIHGLNPPNSALTPRVDWLVLASPNAVTHGLAALQAARVSPRRIAAVGPGTARAAVQAGLGVDVAPSHGGGADDLLVEPDFQPQANERVVVMAGRGGRRRLQNCLRERGVDVVNMPVYARLPAADRLDVPADWQAQALDITVLTSVDGLRALLGMADASTLAWLDRSRLVTVCQRVAKAAMDAGFASPVVAAGASDQALVRAVIDALE